MAQNNQLVDLSAARTFIEANWPNDPLLLHIALNLLEKLPRVDAVEVVRCKGCKHWEKETGSCTEHPTYYDHGMDWYIYDEDDFCSCGERKDND